MNNFSIESNEEKHYLLKKYVKRNILIYLEIFEQSSNAFFVTKRIKLKEKIAEALFKSFWID